MNKQKTLMLMLISFFMISAGMIFLSEDPIPEGNRATINANIMEHSDGTWRVKDNNGNITATIVAAKADNINFRVIGSDAIFSFPEGFDIHKHFIVPEGVFVNTRNHRLSANQTLRLDVRPDAPAVQTNYDVYVLRDSKYVIGNSPPVLIIR
ncbi:hypothetical protein AB2B38_010345 [Balneola sp. MJW-20]|uniref:hypothetical protein n=1 Tax=Gracilimonas aurantiaca TaxID=3234185 RepID=UPI0034672A9E